ncbi:hypothetical protein GGU11DRAFT_758311 [Lentinula aff. detonsa]|nr:hypothetical protein GGU11DRAFT_758311 [Lentinula aff. detonsa]
MKTQRRENVLGTWDGMDAADCIPIQPDIEITNAATGELLFASSIAGGSDELSSLENLTSGLRAQNALAGVRTGWLFWTGCSCIDSYEQTPSQTTSFRATVKHRSQLSTHSKDLERLIQGSAWFMPGGYAQWVQLCPSRVLQTLKINLTGSSMVAIGQLNQYLLVQRQSRHGFITQQTKTGGPYARWVMDFALTFMNGEVIRYYLIVSSKSKYFARSSWFLCNASHYMMFDISRLTSFLLPECTNVREKFLQQAPFVITLIVVASAVGSTVAGLMLSARLFQNGNSQLMSFYNTKAMVEMGIALVLAAFSEILALATISFSLHNSRTGYKQTDTVLKKLFTFFVSRGIILASAQIAGICVYFVSEHPLNWLTWNFISTKLYGITVCSQAGLTFESQKRAQQHRLPLRTEPNTAKSK